MIVRQWDSLPTLFYCGYRAAEIMLRGTYSHLLENKMWWWLLFIIQTVASIVYLISLNALFCVNRSWPRWKAVEVCIHVQMPINETYTSFSDEMKSFGRMSPFYNFPLKLSSSTCPSGTAIEMSNPPPELWWIKIKLLAPVWHPISICISSLLSTNHPNPFSIFGNPNLPPAVPNIFNFQSYLGTDTWMVCHAIKRNQAQSVNPKQIVIYWLPININRLLQDM